MVEVEEEWPVAKEREHDVWTSEVTLEPKTAEVPEIAMKEVEVEVRRARRSACRACAACAMDALLCAPSMRSFTPAIRNERAAALQVPRTVTHTETIQHPVPVQREVMVEEPVEVMQQVEVDVPVERMRAIEVEKPVVTYEERTVERAVTVAKDVHTTVRLARSCPRDSLLDCRANRRWCRTTTGAPRAAHAPLTTLAWCRTCMT